MTYFDNLCRAMEMIAEQPRSIFLGQAVAEKGTGMIQAFRRADSVYESARFKLLGLRPEARYELKRLDEPGSRVEYTGTELMRQGFLVGITNPPAAVVVVYQRK